MNALAEEFLDKINGIYRMDGVLGMVEAGQDADSSERAGPEPGLQSGSAALAMPD